MRFDSFIYLKIDESNKVRKSLFLKTLQNDAMNTYRNFDRYLGTITQQLPFEDPHRLQIAENLLNMVMSMYEMGLAVCLKLHVTNND
jgi:hypothetical protein